MAVKDKKLIQDYLKGDEKSLEILIARYLKPIYSFVYKNVGGREYTEDITQEVFVKVWKNLKRFNQKKNFKPWIFQIAKNTSIDFLRKKKTIPFSGFENIAEKPLNLLEKLSDKKVLATAMQSLTDEEQKVINLRHIEGLSFKEIAEIFKESINTVKSRHRRILLRLRENIKES